MQYKANKKPKTKTKQKQKKKTTKKNKRPIGHIAHPSNLGQYRNNFITY
jgi:hypothetical protein